MKRKLLVVTALIFITLYSKSQTLYGFNQNSYPAYDNEAFVDSIAALHPDLIRYPDGIGSNYFDWKNPHNNNDLPSLRGMQQKVGCDILFVLNMNTETIGYNMEMLDSASRLGIAIKWIEFGSEVNNTGNALLKKFHGDGIQYGTECKAWAAVIKEKYPNAKFGAWGENKPDHPNWNAELLSVFTPDALVSHLYPNDTAVSRNGIIDSAFFVKVIDHSFERSGIDFKIPVWITEFNMNPKQLKYLKRGEHRRGLVILADRLKYLGCQMLIFHSLSQGKNGAFEVYDDDHVKMRVTGKAFRDVKNELHK